MSAGEKILLGETRKGNKVYLPPKLRSTHMHVLGASGRGKSKFIEHMIREDIRQGNGLCLIDPHGYLYDDLARWIEERGFAERRTIRLFEPSWEGWTFGFNPLDFAAADDLSYGVDAMVRVCAQVWGGEDTSKTPLLKRVLRSVFYALAAGRLTLLEAQHLVNATDPDGLRAHLTANLPDPIMGLQWREFNALGPPEFREQFGSANNRLMEFLAAEVIRTVIGQTKRIVNFRRAMDEGEIILVNLASRGRLSDDNARLLGALMVNDLFLKARRRPEHSRPFYLYIDECSLFVNDDIARILDEARKFGLHLILAHQHLNQLKRAGETIYSAVMTNAQTKMVFGGLNVEDAEVMARTVFMGEYDLEEVKHRYDAPRVVEYVKTWLHSHASSEGYSSSTSTGGGYSTGVSQSDREDARIVSSSGASSSYSEGSGYSSSQSHGRSETYVPRLQMGPTQSYSLEEQIYRSMALMINQATQDAIVKMPMQRSRQVRTLALPPGVARAERLVRLRESLFRTTPFASRIDDVRQALGARREALYQAARQRNRQPRSGSFRE